MLLTLFGYKGAYPSPLTLFCLAVICSPKLKKKKLSSLLNVLYCMCIALISMKRLRMWSMRVCMDRLYLRWPITHLFPIGEIGWTGNKSCNLLILLRVFTSLNKNSVISAFMGFIRRVTILRPRHWSSQRVKWREGRRSDTQTLPPPSLSPPISLTSWSPLLSLTLPHLLPQRSP